MRRSPGVARAALAAAVLLLCVGCGYALVGRGTIVDPTIKKIGVPLFAVVDPHTPAGLDQKITRRIIEELLKRGRFDVVQEAAGVDALVEGSVTGYAVRPVGFDEARGGTQGQATRFEITMTARVKYGKVGAAEPIWTNEAFSYRDEFDLGDPSAPQSDRQTQALDRLSLAFARNLVATMLEAF